MKFFVDMDVFKNVLRETAKKLGTRVIRTRWVDLKRASDEVRSRLVAQDVNT